MTYFFETYGCEMNIAESASVEQLFLSRGWTKAEDVQIADVVVINTCSVRATAETRIFGRLGFFTGLKKVRSGEPGAKTRNMEVAASYVEKNGPKPVTIVVMGCMAERLLKSLQKEWPSVDYVVGTYAKNKFGDIISRVEQGLSPIEVDEEPVYSFADTSYEEGAFSTFVPIMHGCNNFCSYCIVPYVRGREVSRPVDQILKEIDLLSSRGVKEITMLGQNVNSYHGENGMDFTHLLETVTNHIDKTNSSIDWIRFESSNPKDFSDSLIDFAATNSHICKGFHIAVQHGANPILKAMNRKYTRELYLTLVEKIRTKMPDIALSTDIMIGFPGETDSDFEQVVSLMKEVRYDSAFMYYYNPREGTPAAKMENQIDLDIKKSRLQKIIDLQLEITQERLARRVGQDIKVLADIVSRDNKDEILGKTEHNGRIAFKGEKSLIGKFVNVHIDSVNGNTYKGTLLQ